MKQSTVVITGGSSGIGLATARLFFEKGYNVVIGAQNKERIQEAYNTIGPSERILTVQGDIADRSANLHIIDQAVERFGTVDVLINNAGVFGPKPFLDVLESELDRYLNINLKGTFFTSQAAIRVMLKQGAGRIINISTALVEHAIAGIPASAAVVSKGAIHTLTKQLAAEFGKNNIMVNTITPGIIRTPLHEKAGINADVLASLHLLDRIGEVEEVAEVAFLLANSNFITGANYNVEGGHTAGHHFQ
jgi:NAD(P)-dependent dehydrogenase (short-subunit alcohol dehydrogenase family)